MTPRIRLFYDLRAKGFNVYDALKISEVDWPMGLTLVICLVLLLGMVGYIDSLWYTHAENAAAPHRAQAAENLKAFNHVMQGGSFLLEDGRALFTCPALESKI